MAELFYLLNSHNIDNKTLIEIISNSRSIARNEDLDSLLIEMKIMSKERTIDSKNPLLEYMIWFEGKTSNIVFRDDYALSKRLKLYDLLEYVPAEYPLKKILAGNGYNSKMNDRKKIYFWILESVEKYIGNQNKVL